MSHIIEWIDIIESFKSKIVINSEKFMLIMKRLNKSVIRIHKLVVMFLVLLRLKFNIYLHWMMFMNSG